MEDVTVIPGNLLLYNDFTDEEYENFIYYLGNLYSETQAMYLNELVKKDNLIRFLDVMQDNVIKIPPREFLVEIASRIKLFSECKRCKFNENEYKHIGKRYGKSVTYLKRIVTEMQEILGDD